MQYPGVLGIDVTFGKNNKKRPQFCVIGKNARNRNINIVDTFLPSQQQYVFWRLFKDALPRLLEKFALSCTQIIMTDQDLHTIEGLSHPLNDLCLYGSALHRLCKWLKVLKLRQLTMFDHDSRTSELSFPGTIVNSPRMTPFAGCQQITRQQRLD